MGSPLGAAIFFPVGSREREKVGKHWFSVSKLRVTWTKCEQNYDVVDTV